MRIVRVILIKSRTAARSGAAAAAPKGTTVPARTPLALIAAAAALALLGCAGADGSAPAGDAGEQLRVVATTTQLADFALRVGGDDISLTGLLAPGASAHHFDPSPADLLALARADVLLVNGAGLEGFVESAVEASGFDGTVITASAGIDLALAQEITAEAEAESGHEHDEGQAGDEHGDEHDDADEGEHADEHDHDGLNPHIWTSVRFAQGMVAELADGFAAADPAHAAAFRERAAEYTDQLESLDAWIGAQYARVPASERLFVSGHDSLTYYLHDYDIEFIGSLVPSFEDNAEPSAAQLDALIAEIRAHGVKAVFVESSMNPKLARTVAEEAGIRAVDTDQLYADSLGAPGTPGATYLGATIANTRTILTGWGASIDPLPAELEG
ncbi:MAG: zinc ABC transporter substrate-binding protein [Leucobacter sp.]|nr:zinc ABC transporter substrate-binding protein [Leucobacter sp.]